VSSSGFLAAKKDEGKKRMRGEWVVAKIAERAREGRVTPSFSF